MSKTTWTEEKAKPTHPFFSEMIFDEIADNMMHLQFMGLSDQELSINEMHIGGIRPKIGEMPDPKLKLWYWLKIPLKNEAPFDMMGKMDIPEKYHKYFDEEKYKCFSNGNEFLFVGKTLLKQ